MNVPVLEARVLEKAVTLPNRQRLAVIRSVDLTVEAGESVAIIGRSGSGKSTLLSLIGLLARPDHGMVSINGKNATSVSDRHRAMLRNRHIGFVFQAYSPVRHMSATDNTGLPLTYGDHVFRAERRRRVAAALELVGLTDRARSKPRQLSGGEQQRVAIARALVRQPQLILADEPTGALDIETANSVFEALTTATRERGYALVVVTHDRDIASRLSRTVEIVDGRLRTEEHV